MLKQGDKAPDFELIDTNGNKVRLSGFMGKDIVLYFYPKDNTPGCTREACNLRDNFSSLKNKNIVILGISLDNQESHKKFTKKYSLPFPLLSDTKAEVAEKYGVYRKKLFFGKSLLGIKRTTFLIDKNGLIKHIFDSVDVNNHTQQILEALRK